jgi:Domain of unknown function (DUF1906)
MRGESLADNYAGFDTSAFPGLDTMAWLKSNTNLEWCGFYLGPAPSHGAADWMGERAALVGQGWGLAPIFVGAQLIGPGSRDVSAAQGTTDGDAAADLMAVAGFAPGAHVYLDLENGPPFQAPQTSYVEMWAAAVLGRGFVPDVYCSHAMAADVGALLPTSRIWAFRVATVTDHDVMGSEFPTPDPAGCGYPAATMWQNEQNAIIDAGGKSLLVDLSTSALQDPSA